MGHKADQDSCWQRYAGRFLSHHRKVIRIDTAARIIWGRVPARSGGKMKGLSQSATILIVTAAMFATPAWAISCPGTVNTIILAPEGDLFVDFGYNRVKICVLDASLTVDRGAISGGSATITAARCNALFSMFVTAHASGKQVVVHVNRADCNFTDGAVPNPYPYQVYFPR